MIVSANVAQTPLVNTFLWKSMIEMKSPGDLKKPAVHDVFSRGREWDRARERQACTYRCATVNKQMRYMKKVREIFADEDKLSINIM